MATTIRLPAVLFEEKLTASDAALPAPWADCTIVVGSTSLAGPRGVMVDHGAVTSSRQPIAISVIAASELPRKRRLSTSAGFGHAPPPGVTPTLCLTFVS